MKRKKKKEILVTESSAISNCSLPLTLGERQSQERKKKKKHERYFIEPPELYSVTNDLSFHCYFLMKHSKPLY